ncbi:MULTISPECIES: DUF2019 domain-containing protein [unclassified Bosea (in: a-proteobacteria)]|uniref:DUF2019 domain-containing protein n=1 Tax=unclassified Bosea (in: a-proteobacteria) TaxID=2653178 RepID=UPI000F74DABB|nr:MULTISPECIES: DUF2019 domain-containing protein [unclassified Bosea (in: a-proteobacteria)]AZO78621.1 hypothetical protein BLM15_14080 [Bosea sp. Tri-49]RXT17592.1 hypothetical protein B5U98_26350 [Bosea sp. Tri-39]RXT40964.1 hypothetical protein B5U99_04220 [Bosea sp. Tri-54]
MKRVDLHSMSVGELLLRYIELATQRERAEVRSLIAEQNRAIREIWRIEDELKLRPGDQRIALTSLFDHPNRQVRCEAALATAYVAPVASRRMLETIIRLGWEPQSSQARERLMNLDSGFFVPS